MKPGLGRRGRLKFPDTCFVQGPGLSFMSVPFYGGIGILVVGPWVILPFRALFVQTRNITSFSSHSFGYDGRAWGLDRPSSPLWADCLACFFISKMQWQSGSNEIMYLRHLINRQLKKDGV